MRKTLGSLLVISLVFGALTLPAAAKKKKKVKPIAYTLYMHGAQPIGEAEYVDSVANATGFMKMDEAEPTEPAPKSFSLINYVRGPNTSCSGNSLFPTWTSAVAGKVTGDLKLYLNAVSHVASNVQVDVFADSNGGCDSDVTGSTGYVPPVASTTATLGAGPAENEILFEDVNFKALANIVIMVTPTEIELDETRLDPTSQTRVFYDSPDFATRLEFTCTPTTGKSCIQ